MLLMTFVMIKLSLVTMHTLICLNTLISDELSRSPTKRIYQKNVPPRLTCKNNGLQWDRNVMCTPRSNHKSIGSVFLLLQNVCVFDKYFIQSTPVIKYANTA